MTLRTHLHAATLLSLARIPLALTILLVLDSPLRYLLFAVLVATDALDGWAARRTGTESAFGALLDPATDKAAALILFIALFTNTGLPWKAAALFFLRDAFVLTFAATAPFTSIDTDTLKARPAGKGVTILQFTTLAALLAPLTGLILPLFWLVWLASLAAITDYTAFLTAHRDRRPLPGYTFHVLILTTLLLATMTGVAAGMLPLPG